jgi:hypothetical protein
MTEEQIKFTFNLLYRLIATESHDGTQYITFGELVNWAAARKIDDDTFLTMIDNMETCGLVTRQGERYYPNIRL